MEGRVADPKCKWAFKGRWQKKEELAEKSK